MKRQYARICLPATDCKNPLLPLVVTSICVHACFAWRWCRSEPAVAKLVFSEFQRIKREASP